MTEFLYSSHVQCSSDGGDHSWFSACWCVHKLWVCEPAAIRRSWKVSRLQCAGFSLRPPVWDQSHIWGNTSNMKHRRGSVHKNCTMAVPFFFFFYIHESVLVRQINRDPLETMETWKFFSKYIVVLLLYINIDIAYYLFNIHFASSTNAMFAFRKQTLAIKLIQTASGNLLQCYSWLCFEKRCRPVPKHSNLNIAG